MHATSLTIHNTSETYSTCGTEAHSTGPCFETPENVLGEENFRKKPSGKTAKTQKDKKTVKNTSVRLSKKEFERLEYARRKNAFFFEVQKIAYSKLKLTCNPTRTVKRIKGSIIFLFNKKFKKQYA